MMAGMQRLEPFRLGPILVERPWGGSRLADYGKSLRADTPIGESWELCDLPQAVAPHVDDPSSVVLDGAFAGAHLRTVVADAADALLGPVRATADGRFPLLFKWLDAREHLSVQVHPPADYVTVHPEARLKTESWYVIDAAPGSELYLDVREGTTRADIEAVMGTPAIVPLLGARPAVRGAFHHVPAGLIHALGAGTLVAELQTPSDTTYRIYDWAVEYGRAPRRLHAAESLASIRIAPDEAFSLEPDDAAGVRDFVSNEHYWMREHRLEEQPRELARRPGPTVINVLAGLVTLGGLQLAAGSTAIVPHTASVTQMTGPGAIVLEMGPTAPAPDR